MCIQKAHDFVLKQNPTHIGLRSSKELTKILRDCGFVVGRAEWSASFFPGLKQVEKVLGRSFQTFRYRLTIRALTPR